MTGAALGDTSTGSTQSPAEQGKAGEGEGFAYKGKALSVRYACVSRRLPTAQIILRVYAANVG
jgi:hypothetical protein